MALLACSDKKDSFVSFKTYGESANTVPTDKNINVINAFTNLHIQKLYNKQKNRKNNNKNS